MDRSGCGARYLGGADISLEIESARECRCCPAIPTPTCAPARHAGLSTNCRMDHQVSSSHASEADRMLSTVIASWCRINRRRRSCRRSRWKDARKRPADAHRATLDMSRQFPRSRATLPLERAQLWQLPPSRSLLRHALSRHGIPRSSKYQPNGRRRTSCLWRLRTRHQLTKRRNGFGEQLGICFTSGRLHHLLIMRGLERSKDGISYHT